jgi:hypothetical protein
MGALVDLICSHPPAAQPGLQLLTVIATSPQHWSKLSMDAMVFRLAAQLAPAVQEQPELQQQLLELVQQVVSQALRSDRVVKLCADEQLLMRALRPLCGATALAPPVLQLLLDMLAVDNSAAVRRAMVSSGALDCILQSALQSDQDAEPAGSSCGEATLQLFVELLSSELRSGEGGRTAAELMAQKAVEAGALAAWLQQLRSPAEPPEQAVQEAVALVVLAHPQAVEAVAQDSVVPLLLQTLRYALAGPAAAQDAPGFDPDGSWFMDNQLSRQQQLLATKVRTL